MEHRARKRFGSVGYAEYDPHWPEWIRVLDRLLPPWVDVVIPGSGDQPTLTAHLEVINNVPMCTSLKVERVDGGREVRQRDLSAVHVSEIVNEIYGALSLKFEIDEDGVLIASEGFGRGIQAEAIKQIAESRKGRGARKITPEFLQGVADIYRANIADNPAQSVQRELGVSPRMAGVYIRRARDLGLLPETTGGKKKA